MNELRNPWHHPREAIKIMKELLDRKSPITFVRFSDGETEILKNNPLVINENGVSWSKGNLAVRYPTYDHKEFIPERDGELRADLIRSVQHSGPGYVKGVPARHNASFLDKSVVVDLNRNGEDDLTFADLFLNSNFRYFRSELVPLFDKFDSKIVVANFRSSVKNLGNGWKFISLPDGIFQNYSATRDQVIKELRGVEEGSIVLSSASSLTSVIGHQMHRNRPDVTFLDIGTSLHDLLDLNMGIRSYHYEVLPWTMGNARRKARYLISRERRLKW